MEQGKVSSITGYNDGGTISDNQGQMINFTSSGFVGRNRSSLKIGDMVWFERVGANVSATAINIRSC